MTNKEFEERKQRLIRDLVDKHIATIEQIETKQLFHCEQWDAHIWDTYATGGHDGHTISRCKLCDYKEEGWD